MLDQAYLYNATITRVYDGDTITVDLDLGFGFMMKKQTLRLAGINTPELNSSDERERFDAQRARDVVRKLCKDAEGKIQIRTIKNKKGKYGRWLAILLVDGLNVNDYLIEYGYAQVYE